MSVRDFYLDEIDRWRSGAKATPGQPATGENYALVMREEIKRIEKILDEMETKNEQDTGSESGGNC